ncbi:MAG: hypothetical protein M3245_05630 [Actinomycetota bacterium]|nr:hypothetical protein [Actinomycetota bacterium]
MGQLASDVARKGLALVVLLAAAWIVFKLVLGVVTFVAWVVVAVLAVVAIVWAVRVL